MTSVGSLNGHGKSAPSSGEAVSTASAGVLPTEPPRFHTKVEVRWSDMDAFQHINHARMVTLLEEARIPWLFLAERPTVKLRSGCVLADLHVQYKGQLRHEDSPLDVSMWIQRLRAVDFTVGYEVRAAGSPPDSPPAVVASTQLAAFDIDTQRLRRLRTEERDYLAQWLAD